MLAVKETQWVPVYQLIIKEHYLLPLKSFFAISIWTKYKQNTAVRRSKCWKLWRRSQYFSGLILNEVCFGTGDAKFVFANALERTDTFYYQKRVTLDEIYCYLNRESQRDNIRVNGYE